MPRTNASSLLDFHMSENHSKPEYRYIPFFPPKCGRTFIFVYRFQAKGRDQPQKKEHKLRMWRMDEVEPGLPTGGTAEPGDKAMQWDSLHSHKEQPRYIQNIALCIPLSGVLIFFSTNVQSTSTSSMFDENPLSRKVH